MSISILEFEKPIAEVTEKIEALQLAASDNPELLPQIDKLRLKETALTKKIYSRLTTWQKVQVARHPSRPHTLDFIERIFDGFEELHGDRQFADDASFELLARRVIAEIPRYISIKKYDVSVTKKNENKILSKAKAELEVDGEKIICEGEGNGPVHALDNAIRNNVDKLEKYAKYLKDLKLVDYKVRILNTGTEAVTRVSIESTDSKGKSWFTIGVSPNIIEASFRALIDSLDYKLFKDNAPASN